MCLKKQVRYWSYVFWVIKNEAYAKILFPTRAKTATERKKKKRKKKDNYKAFLFSRKSKKRKKDNRKIFCVTHKRNKGKSNTFCVTCKRNKLHLILGNFDLSCLNYDINLNIKRFYNNIFQHGAIPLINKPTRVTNSKTAILIDTFTNAIFDKT